MHATGVSGIMAAMPQELEAIIGLMDDCEPVIMHGGRAFHQGSINGHRVVAAFSRCGKVAAAATATELIVRFDIGALVFTGLAGGMAAGVRLADVVVPESLMQHDLDARPLFPRFEVPLMEQSVFSPDDGLRMRLVAAAKAAVQSTGAEVYGGLLASGDQFVASSQQRSAILEAVPEVVAVDMEAAAVAQVACDYAVPFAVIRLISDTADELAGGDFSSSLGSLAARFTHEVFRRVFA